MFALDLNQVSVQLPMPKRVFQGFDSLIEYGDKFHLV